MSQHIIDCDAAPFLPDGWSVHEEDQLPSLVRGQLEWDPSRVHLYLSREQDHGVSGHALREELVNQNVLPANVLDYLLKHPELVPDDWEGDSVLFWTIYRDSRGGLYVRCLCRDSLDSRLRWVGLLLDYDLYGKAPAAVLLAA